MSTSATSAGSYFAQLPVHRHDPMQRLRSLIFRLCPDLEEGLLRGLPTYFRDDEPVFGLSVNKQYMVLHVFRTELLGLFRHELLAYSCGKRCIRFKEMGEREAELYTRILGYEGIIAPVSSAQE